MKVRDHTLRKEEYKGRPTDTSDEECPCRPCFNAHDCGEYKKVRMECATRYNSGCPDPIPMPEHIPNRMKICKRCKKDLKNGVSKES